jgi:hypothetical protein
MPERIMASAASIRTWPTATPRFSASRQQTPRNRGPGTCLLRVAIQSRSSGTPTATPTVSTTIRNTTGPNKTVDMLCTRGWLDCTRAVIGSIPAHFQRERPRMLSQWRGRTIRARPSRIAAAR